MRNLLDGSVRDEAYDALVLSTGSKAIRPPLSGIDLPGIFVLRTIPDSHKLRAAAKNAKRAVIIGAGFIGLEMAEKLANLGIAVTMYNTPKNSDKKTKTSYSNLVNIHKKLEQNYEQKKNKLQCRI